MHIYAHIYIYIYIHTKCSHNVYLENAYLPILLYDVLSWNISYIHCGQELDADTDAGLQVTL